MLSDGDKLLIRVVQVVRDLENFKTAVMLQTLRVLQVC